MPINTVPPKSAQNNAERGLELRRKWGRGGTAVGVARARDISNGASLSRETIARMSAFERHRQNYQPDKREADGGETAGTIAWLLWGGTSGIEWARRKLEEIDSNKGKPMQIEKLAFALDEIKAMDDGESRTIEGFGSIFGNVDGHNDVVLQGAFAKSIRKRKPAMLWQHKSDMPIGVWEVVKETPEGLYLKGRILDTQLGNDAYTLAKEGAISGLSIGFSTKQYEIDSKANIRKLKEVDLYEVSLVTFPANEKATITSVKTAPETEREFEQFLREAGYSREAAKIVVAKGFRALNGQRDAEVEVLTKEQLEGLSKTLLNILNSKS
jgi:HK97 family phage prohead protease